MNADVKKLWLDALREEGRPQGTDYLRSDEGCCANGVLVEEAVKAGVIEPGVRRQLVRRGGDVVRLYWVYTDDETASYLPTEVMEWAGLKDTDPELRVIAPDDRPCFRSVADLNDAGFTFAEIADLIEEQL